MAKDWTTDNWRVSRHVYEDDWANFRDGALYNSGLPEPHFRALVLAARTNPFGRRSRKDDSLLKAIGNWLYSRKYGAWRNTNRTMRYKGRNKELWKDVEDRNADYSLAAAAAEAGSGFRSEERP